MKKWLSVVMIGVLCLALVIGVACGGGEKEEGVKEVKFGLAGPLSGILGAVIGTPVKQALELADEQIGEFTVAGESYRWNLMVLDNQWTSAGGVATATKLIFDEGVKFMHQAGSSSAMAAQPICEEAGVLLDMSGGGLEAFGPDKPHTFQISPTYVECTPAFFKWLTTEHPEVKRVAIAQTNDETGHAIADAAVGAAEYYGLEVVATEFTPVELTELYPLATKLVNKNPDLVIASTTVLSPMWEMGYEGLGAGIIWFSSMAESAGWENVQGYLIYQPQPMGEWLSEELREFVAEYENRYGAEFTQGPLYACTILDVLTEVLKKAGTVDDVDKIIETLETETFDTWIGPVRFGAEELIGIGHWLMWPVPISEVSGQELHTVTVVPADEAWELAAEVYK